MQFQDSQLWSKNIYCVLVSALIQLWSLRITLTFIIGQGLPVSSLLTPLRKRLPRKAWTKLTRPCGVSKQIISVVKPSGYIAYCISHLDLFKKFFLGNTSKSERATFWSEMKKLPMWQFLGIPDAEEATRTIPFKLYGDKGPYFKGKSLQIFSMSSLFAHAGNTLDSRLLLWVKAAFILALKLETGSKKVEFVLVYVPVDSYSSHYIYLTNKVPYLQNSLCLQPKATLGHLTLLWTGLLKM